MKTKPRKYIIRFMSVLIISLLIEIFIFNFSFIFNKVINKVDTTVYSKDILKLINWNEKDGKLISSFDPMIVFEGLNQNIKNIKIDIVSDYTIPYVEIFYTNENNPVLNGDLKVYSDVEFNDKTKIDLSEFVKDIRIDLGDAEGVVLEDIIITFNDFDLNLSISRILAINLIYWIGVILFAMQRPPKYDM